ncbi:hypothetical protein OH214_06135 [Idiomarina abyssalis]|mgnify:FL=1|uniref:hypothetical protein n=1 Tax=Idiomarina abyssalis TaxID=86102 RepID=UPI000C4701D2|nr:hypothetical protein [Idiomarina abyssalis]MBE92480.1 hypothetical protein [Idiomarina sp.]MDA6066702.1 hypothetical protein [Idiomarina abyssalis]|tara:strand:+ start:320 stop:523 length:204 start_codon:yes stop_codon:yes gene_type:complete
METLVIIKDIIFRTLLVAVGLGVWAYLAHSRKKMGRSFIFRHLMGFFYGYLAFAAFAFTLQFIGIID